MAHKVAKKEKKRPIHVWRGFRLVCGFLNLRVIKMIPSGVVRSQTNQILLKKLHHEDLHTITMQFNLIGNRIHLVKFTYDVVFEEGEELALFCYRLNSYA